MEFGSVRINFLGTELVGSSASSNCRYATSRLRDAFKKIDSHYVSQISYIGDIAHKSLRLPMNAISRISFCAVNRISLRLGASRQGLPEAGDRLRGSP